MKVLLTGATGFVGEAMTRVFLDAGVRVCALVRERSLGKLPGHSLLEYVVGDVCEVTPRLANCDAIVHLVAVIRERTSEGITFERLNYRSVENMTRVALHNGINRFILMSAIKPPCALLKKYYASKVKAEETLRATSLKWTIVRPSFIYGTRFLGKHMGYLGYVSRLASPRALAFSPSVLRCMPISRERIAHVFLSLLYDQSYCLQTLEGKALFDVGTKARPSNS